MFSKYNFFFSELTYYIFGITVDLEDDPRTTPKEKPSFSKYVEKPNGWSPLKPSVITDDGDMINFGNIILVLP